MTDLVLLAHETGGGGGGSGTLVPLLLAGAVLVSAGLSQRNRPDVKRWVVWGLVGLGVVVAVGGILLTSRGNDRSDVHLSIIEPAFNAMGPEDVVAR